MSILTSISPNTQNDDRTLARQIFRTPSLWQDATKVNEVEQRLERRLGQPFVLISSGRAALYRLLQAYGIGQGDEVILQAFTCSVVPAAIQWAGATPIYADISPTTYNLDPESVQQKITSRTRAVIIQHTFGIPGPIEALKKLCAERDIYLIEDCAHALGATYQGKQIGTFGDAAFFSFGRDKVLSSVYGGAVSSDDSALIQKIREQQATLPYPPNWWITQQLRHPLLMNKAIKFYFTAKLGQILIRLAQHFQLISKAVTQSEKQGAQPEHVAWKYPPALAALLSLQLKKLDRYTAHRRQTVQKYLSALSVSAPNFPAGSEPGWLRFPLQIAAPAQLHQAARQQNIILGDWYDTPISPKDVDPTQFGYTLGSCPQAEAVSKKIINLPTHPRLSDSDVERVIECVKAYL